VVHRFVKVVPREYRAALDARHTDGDEAAAPLHERLARSRAPVSHVTPFGPLADERQDERKVAHG